MVLIFDTEGYHKGNGFLREIAWVLLSGDQIVESQSITAISSYQKKRKIPAVVAFSYALKRASLVVGHNLQHDIDSVEAEHKRLGKTFHFPELLTFDTCKDERVVHYCALHGKVPNRYKYPTLDELYLRLFNAEIPGRKVLGRHSALIDTTATMCCFVELKKRNIFSLV